MSPMQIPTNCKNCGSPLSSSKCDYCGTENNAALRLENCKSVIVETEMEQLMNGKSEMCLLQFAVGHTITFETDEGVYKIT